MYKTLFLYVLHIIMTTVMRRYFKLSHIKPLLTHVAIILCTVHRPIRSRPYTEPYQSMDDIYLHSSTDSDVYRILQQDGDLQSVNHFQFFTKYLICSALENVFLYFTCLNIIFS